MRKETIIAG